MSVSEPRASAPARLGVWVGLAVAGGLGIFVVLVALLAAGELRPLPLGDPGVLVRVGLPVVTVVTNITAAATIGFLGLASFVIPDRTTTRRREYATRLGMISGLAWTVSAIVGLLFAFADMAGLGLADPAYWPQLGKYLLTIYVTRVEAISLLFAMLATTLAAVARARSTTAWATLFAIAGVVILAMTGHSATDTGHADAVNVMGFHLLGAGIWVGGLIALVAMHSRLGQDLGVVVRRYSIVAAWCFGAVGLSGVIGAKLRIAGLSSLDSAYGAMLIAKVVALIALGVFGWQHRRRMIDRLSADASDGRAFGSLALAEVAVMGIAFGVAAALSRTPTPDAVRLPGTNSVLDITGYPDPGPMAWGDWFFAWRVEWLFLTVAVVSMGLYAAGYVRLVRRGDAWPWIRTASWMVGWAIFIWATSGGPGIWGRVSFSVHMVMHMAVAMIVPLFLVPAAPMTLALRALKPRRDKTWGPRELITQVSHSRVLHVFTNPVVAAALFFISLAAFYYSPTFRLALDTHTGHVLMMAHFLLTGYLFVWVLVGIDPGPKKWHPMMLLVILFITVGFHAFFGVILTGTDTLLADGIFADMNLPWMPDVLADQVRAGEIAWGIGEAPTLTLALMVAVQWVKSDKIETARLDRQAERDGDAELKAYNEMLAQRRVMDERFERQGH